MDEIKQINLTLNPNGVAQPAQAVVMLASQVVGACLRALEKDDLSDADLTNGFASYRFDGLNLSDEDKRLAYANWILSKGFQDLARGVRETLEEAKFYIEILKTAQGKTTIRELEERMATIRADAAKPTFPKLLEDVNASLKEPMAFDAEFLSIQKVRNCLEHRGGRVGPRDIDSTTGKLVLSFPRLRLFYRRGDEEVELAVGEVLDTHSVNDPSAADREVPIYMNRVTRSREYALGDPVTITGNDFMEIAMACFMFAADVAAKLPAVPQPIVGDHNASA